MECHKESVVEASWRGDANVCSFNGFADFNCIIDLI